MEALKEKRIMEALKEKRITRGTLSGMRHGDQISVVCVDGRDLDSQRNVAYFMQKIENCKFTCQTDGLRLTVTRHDNAQA